MQTTLAEGLGNSRAHTLHERSELDCRRTPDDVDRPAWISFAQQPHQRMTAHKIPNCAHRENKNRIAPLHRIRDGSRQRALRWQSTDEFYGELSQVKRPRGTSHNQWNTAFGREPCDADTLVERASALRAFAFHSWRQSQRDPDARRVANSRAADCRFPDICPSVPFQFDPAPGPRGLRCGVGYLRLQQPAPDRR